MTIVRDDVVRSGDPHIEGSRITVFDVKRRVIDTAEDPHIVAGEYDISMAELYGALSYYYEHRDESVEREREASDTRRQGERRTRELLADIDGGEPVEQAD